MVIDVDDATLPESGVTTQGETDLVVGSTASSTSADDPLAKCHSPRAALTSAGR